MANELNDLGLYSSLIAHALEDGVFALPDSVVGWCDMKWLSM